MPQGLTNINPIRIKESTSNCLYQVKIFNTSAVSLYLGKDSASANKENGFPIVAGASDFILTKDEVWIGADEDSTGYRFLSSRQ